MFRFCIYYFQILQSVENIKLDPSVLEPEPVELGNENGEGRRAQVAAKSMPDGAKWSGDATRNQGLKAEGQEIKIDFGDDDKAKADQKNIPKDVPIWITQSTVEGTQNLQSYGTEQSSSGQDLTNTDTRKMDADDDDEITRLLLQHEKKPNSAVKALTGASGATGGGNDSESDDDSDVMEDVSKPTDKVEAMSSDEDADDGIPTVKVGNEEITITDVNEDIINKMTSEEKDRYTQIFQEFYSHMYD